MAFSPVGADLSAIGGFDPGRIREQARSYMAGVAFSPVGADWSAIGGFDPAAFASKLAPTLQLGDGYPLRARFKFTFLGT